MLLPYWPKEIFPFSVETQAQILLMFMKPEKGTRRLAAKEVNLM